MTRKASMGELARYHYERKGERRESAEAYLKRSMELLEANDATSELAECCSELEMLYADAGDAGKANEYLTRSVRLFRSSRRPARTPRPSADIARAQKRTR